MEQIETEYKEKNKLADASDLRADGLTTSADTLLVKNWQDIIAIYVYEQHKSGARLIPWMLPARTDWRKFLQR